MDDPATWRSATVGPGHTAIVTAVDANYVYVAQQNAMWSKGCGQRDAPCDNAFMAYPLERNPDGQGWSVDSGNLNGIKGRITRGWLHFAEDSGSVATSATNEDVYAIGGDGHLYAEVSTGGLQWSRFDAGGLPGTRRLGSNATSSVSW